MKNYIVTIAAVLLVGCGTQNPADPIVLPGNPPVIHNQGKSVPTVATIDPPEEIPEAVGLPSVADLDAIAEQWFIDHPNSSWIIGPVQD